MTELAEVLAAAGWSWVLWFVVALFVGTTVLRLLAEAKPWVAALFGPLGRYWLRRRDARESRLTEMTNLRRNVIALERENAVLLVAARGNEANADLTRQVEQLAAQLKIVRYRAEMTDAYLVIDGDYHRDLALSGQDDHLPEHISYPEHERRWRQTHPRPY